MNRIAFDQAALATAWGIHFMSGNGVEAKGMKLMDRACGIAYDAQPQLVTAINSGIPSLFTTFVNPAIIETVLEPLNAVELYEEEKQGSWVSDTAMFITAERGGYVTTYGDFNQGGRVTANVNYPQRQSYHYQTFVEYGERETERMGEGRVNWVNRLDMSALRVLLQFQNDSYLFGVGGLQNYGGVNDPALEPPIAPTQSWDTVTDPLVIFGDILRLVQQLVTQSNGILNAKSAMRLGISTTNALNLNKTNQFNYNVEDQVKKNFPNLKFVTIPQFSNPTGGGELLQLFALQMKGHVVVRSAFTEKMRNHAMIQKASSWEQKKSQGTWGTIWYYPIMCAQMIG